MRSHNHRSISNHAPVDMPQNPPPSTVLPLPGVVEATVLLEALSKNSRSLPESEVAGLDAAPISPSQRLPLIAHSLREARVGIAELRYEGRGAMGGFITEFHDRHRQKSLSHLIDGPTAQQLTGFLWQLVLRRQPSWNDHAGSFGVVTWNLKTDLIRHVHHQRNVEVKTTVIDGL
ncbi:MAG TPA: hypothetical protein VNZ53_11080 [Steroidobacteraceae bacterium]|nr:hypothetical protein [Steroidobacteraceae bacterium]